MQGVIHIINRLININIALFAVLFRLSSIYSQPAIAILHTARKAEIVYIISNPRPCPLISGTISANCRINFVQGHDCTFYIIPLALMET